MMSPRAAPVALALTALAGCYHGKDDVPHVTSSSSAAASSAGAGGYSATSTSASGAGGHGGKAGTGGMAGTGGADPCATAVLCDDFESYAVGSPPGGKWSSSPSSGTVAVDTAHAHSGKNAVKFSADAVSGYRSVMMALSDPTLLPVAGNVVHGRMMFWLESSPPTSVHWTFIDGSGPVPGQSYHAIYRYGGQLPITNNGMFVGSQLMANYETPDSYQSPPVGPASDCWQHANQEVVPVGAWTCVEWSFDTPNNTMRFWLNGAELKDLAMTGTGQGCVNQPATFSWLAPTVQRIDLGWESYQMDDARVMWVDDVAIGTQRLGCPK